ncbi:MAG: septum formation initiator family protein [Bryobacterales bacterium]
MSPRLKNWSMRSILGLVFGIGAAVWFQQWGYGTLVELKDSLEQERQLEAEVQQIKAENDALDAEIQSLQQEGWEKLARERLGLAKKGEYVVKIPGKK